MKRLEIEWRHLDIDGNTCDRCSETGKALKVAVERLAEECRPGGFEIVFRETALTENEIPESNIILINGTPIEDILPQGRVSESACRSCCECIGEDDIFCRTVEYNGRTYEAIPVSLIREAVCEVAGCC